MNRFLFLSSVLLMWGGALSAQQTAKFNPYTSEPLPEGAPEWMKCLADDPAGVNYFKMDSLFEEWAACNVDVRVKTRPYKPAVNFFRRWQKAYRPFVNAAGKIVLSDYDAYYARIDSLNTRNIRRSRNVSAAVWRSIGPNQTVSEGAKPKDSQACVYRLAVSASEPNILYCGTEAGVVFRSEDKGQNWTACNGAHFFGGSIYALAVHPQNPDIVYAGGGTALWRSEDGGNTWNRVPGIQTRVNSIRFHTGNPNRMTVTTAYDPITRTEGGFYRSEDGGASFLLTLQGIGYDHELKPGDPETVYLMLRPVGGESTLFYTSHDGGATFTASEMLPFALNAGRLAVSEAPGGEDYVYALVTAYELYNNKDGVGKPYILQSKNGGKDWVDKTTRVSTNSWDSRNSFFDLDERQGGQGFFDMTLGVSNKDPELVIFGLCSAYRSTQGGSGGWGLRYGNTAIGGYTAHEKMHPDIQDIAISGNDTWIATDGGIKYSADFFETPGENRMKGVYAADYHGFDMGWNEDVMAGGRWHNGDAVHMASYGEGNTMHVGGVEKATGHVMLSDPKKVYFSDAGRYVMPERIDGAVEVTYDQYFTDKKPFEILKTNGRIVTDPRYALRIIMNGRDADDDWGARDVYQIYRSENEGLSFQSILDTDHERVSNYEYARSNPDVIYVCGYLDIYRTRDHGANWEKLPERPFPEEISDGDTPLMLAVDPNDEQCVWVTNTFSPGAVRYTTDGGHTWTNPLGGELLSQTFCWIILTGDELNGVYLGTNDGARVYYKDDSMTEWMDYSQGLNPGARLTRLVPFYKDGKLRAATNQGIWEIPLVRQDFRPVAQPIALNLGNGDLTDNPGKEVWLDSYSIVKQEPGTRWHWSFSPQPVSVSNPDVRNPKVVFGRPGSYDVTLTITTPSGKTHSRTVKDMIQIKKETGMEDAGTVSPKVTLSAERIASGQNLHMLVSGMPEEKVVTIHNLSGHLMQKHHLGQGERALQIPAGELPAGVYVYEVKTRNAKVFGKFIVQ